MNNNSSKEWKLLNRNIEYKNHWYTGGFDRVEQPDGSNKKYYWAELSDAVVIVARKQDQLIFVDQYRPTIQKQCLELPAGLVEDGESYENAAGRELIEETGYEAEEIELIEKFWCATGVLRHRRGIVFAGQLNSVERKLDNNEFIAVREIPIQEALKKARQKPTNDATLEAILLAQADDYI